MRISAYYPRLLACLLACLNMMMVPMMLVNSFSIIQVYTIKTYLVLQLEKVRMVSHIFPLMRVHLACYKTPFIP